jgi:hypothetical protein
MHDHKPDKHKVKKEREEKMERAKPKPCNYYTSTHKEFIFNLKVLSLSFYEAIPKFILNVFPFDLFKDQNPTIKNIDLCTAFLAKFKEV